MVHRSEEKEREYGPFNESLERAAIIATQLSGVEISTETFMKCMIALKLSRLRYNSKPDTIKDGIAYVYGYGEYMKVRNSEVNDLPFSNSVIELKCTHPNGEEKCEFGRSCARCNFFK